MSYKDYQLNNYSNRNKCKSKDCEPDDLCDLLDMHSLHQEMQHCKIEPMSSSTITHDDKCEQTLDGVVNDYAKAFIVPQVYENIFPMNDALCKGTIFKDLYKPYKEQQKCYY